MFLFPALIRPVHLISKEVLTVSGTYNRTPPSGAAFLVCPMRGGGGAIYCRPNQYGGAGSAAYLQGMIPVTGSDTIMVTVGAGGKLTAPDSNGRSHYDGGGLSQLVQNGSTVLIAGGGGGGSSYIFQGNISGGPGGVVNGSAGTWTDASGNNRGADGAGGTQSSGGPQTNTNGNLDGSGGYGYYPGTACTYLSGGGASSYIASFVTHTSKSANGTAAGIGTVPGQPGTPGYTGSPDFAVTVGQGAYFNTGASSSQTANGNDGGVALYWYSGDPYVAGILY